MVALGAIARTTVRGDRNPAPGLFDPIENRAWAVWHAVRNGVVVTQGTPATGPAEAGRAGVPGYTVEVNMTRKMRDLWGDSFSRLSREEQATFASEVRQALKATGNAVCLRNPGIGGGTHDKPLWWVADQWNDVKVVGQFRTLEPTAAEKRLSPEEAGEDREPAPVEIKHRLPETASAAAKRADVLEQVRERTREKTIKLNAERTDAILEAILEAPYPLYVHEIVERSGVALHHVRNLTLELVQAGTIFRRLEVREERGSIGKANGRYHHLYWHTDPVPFRDPQTYRPTTTVRQILENLEPGRHLSLTRFKTSGVWNTVQGLVEKGEFEIIEIDGKERLRKLEQQPEVVTAAPEQVAEIKHVPVQSPDGDALLQLAGGLKELIDAEVERRTGGLTAETLRQELEAARAEIRQLKATVAGREAERDVARTEAYGHKVRADNAERELEKVRGNLRKLAGI